MAPSATDTTALASPAATALQALPPPKDLSHLFSRVARNRKPSNIKAFYKFMQIPGISNFAGGMPNVKYFPFDTLEAQISNADRWEPSPNYPDKVALSTESLSGSILGHSNSPDKNAPRNPDYNKTSSRISIPKILNEPDITKKVDLATALQYGQVTGYPPLHSFIRQFTNEVLHPSVPYQGGADVILNNGGTDGFSKVLQLLVDPWYEGLHPVKERPGMLCETFVFGNVLTQARPLGVNVVPVEIDEEGMIVEGSGGLREVLENWNSQNGRLPHFLYTVTMGDNPTSGVVGVQRRKEIYALASKYDIIIVEDDPYWYLQFPSAAIHEAKARGYTIPSVADSHKIVKSSGYDFIDSLVPSYLSIDVDGRVIRLDTFSKTVAPGSRLGYATAQPAIIERLTRIAETSTGQPSGFVQALIAQAILGPHSSALETFSSLPESEKPSFTGWQLDGWVRWLEGLRGEYERRMTRMCSILEKNSFSPRQSASQNPDLDGGVVNKIRLFDFDWPRGGMFIWVRVHFEKHPLYQSRGGDIAPVIDGTALANAFLIHSTHAPHLVLGSPGSMFSATPEIREKRGWQYIRLCFAAESDQNIDDGSSRFARSVGEFFKINDTAQIEKLLEELPS
ncbi:aromatic amino acid aminotransferase I [Fusarium globosum]|uniref:Aromatic amino acid aminotransferase I n=1 Tax=Fusarium globosum TaxID=78864 RepID=A0A8H5Y5N1_9HYPO|nr:aromatic amino acid aminotransferase I [Fusarium globosum]